ncbi:hypothetical protein Tco_0216905 [Tanacetum coccineum]
MAVLESCPKHNMVAYLEKTEGNAEFHEVIDFLARSSIHHALTLVNVPVPLDHFPVNSLTNKVFSFMVKKETHLNHNLHPSPPHPSEANVEPLSDPSPRPSPTPHIPDYILESSDGNQGGYSSSDKSLSGNEGDMTLQSVYDL